MAGVRSHTWAEGLVIAGFLGRSLGWYGDGEPAGFVMATLGAVLLLC
jgi:uncharacterized membrane protein YeaQ/YmgE (transglycosylase-associated protein family)